MARASLEELRLDYEDFLRQRGLSLWPPDEPALKRFKGRRCASVEEVRAWVDAERQRPTPTHTDKHSAPNSEDVSVAMSVNVRERPCAPSSAELVANATLSLLSLACYLLDRQLTTQAAAFEKEGGFTERLYRLRSRKRNEERGAG